MRTHLLVLLLAGIVISAPVGEQTAMTAAKSFMGWDDCELIESIDDGAAFVFSRGGEGYVILSGDSDIEPVIAWSKTGEYAVAEDNPLRDMVEADMTSRMAYMQQIPSHLREEHNREWQSLLAGERQSLTTYYPPEGTTESGGWLESTWNQTSPYNRMCPTDPVGGMRSLAGCPAVAMAQIMNFHRTTNGTRLSNADDYHHNWGSRNYHIDDDWMSRGFPSFVTLNSWLDSLDQTYSEMEEPNTNEIAALIFACGVVMQQVYSTDGSGTFGVDQAYSGFQRFGLFDCRLMEDDIPLLYTDIQENIMDGYPVHLAVVTSAWDAGHNLVIDGYSTDDFYHLNFGWGGTYDGWYSLPDDIPYDLSVIEGVVLDIMPETGNISENVLPSDLRIAAYPNPFNSALTITAPENATISIHDTQGRIIADLGKKKIWNAGDDLGSGVYIVKAQIDDVVIDGKAVLIR